MNDRWGDKARCRALCQHQTSCFPTWNHINEILPVLRPFCLSASLRDTSPSGQSTPSAMPLTSLHHHAKLHPHFSQSLSALLQASIMHSSFYINYCAQRCHLYNDASGVKRRVSYLCSPFRALPTMYAQVLLNSVDEPGSFFPVLLLIINSRLQRKGNNERLI